MVSIKTLRIFSEDGSVKIARYIQGTIAVRQHRVVQQELNVAPSRFFETHFPPCQALADNFEPGATRIDDGP